MASSSRSGTSTALLLHILFVLTLALMVVIGLLTQAPDPKTLKYTYCGATSEEEAITRASGGIIEVVLSLIVVAICAAFYITFFNPAFVGLWKAQKHKLSPGIEVTDY